jgi:uncharacterized protein involved in exopolysaccharide biosynthesis
MRALLESNGDGEVSPVSSLDLIFILFKRKWTIFTVVALAMLSVSVWLFLIKEDAFVTEAKLLVKIGPELATPSTVVDQRLQSIDYLSNDVKSEVDILTSTELISQLVDQFDLDKPTAAPVPKGMFGLVKYKAKQVVGAISDTIDAEMIRFGLREQLSPKEKAVSILTKSLSVKVSEGSNVVIADLALPARKNAGAVLNALLDDYLRFRLQVYRDRGDEFFRKSLAERTGQLGAAETKLQNFENSANISSQAKQKDVLLEQISAAERVRSEAVISYQEAQSKVDRLDAELKKKDPDLAALGGFDGSVFQRNLMSDLAQLEKKRQEMSLTELDNSERMQNVRSQYQVLANMLAANLRSVSSERQKELSSRTAELDALQQRLAVLHENEKQWTDLKRQVQSLEDDYQFYRKKLEESTAASAAMQQERTGNVVVIQQGTDPVSPAGLRKLYILGIALVVSICLALVLVSITEFFDHRIYLREDLERLLSVPVMGAIPLLPGKQNTPKLLSDAVAPRLLGAGGEQ